MALFESYERRIDQINAVLNSYGISSIEEAEKITKDAGLDVYNMVKGIQPICFENPLLQIGAVSFGGQLFKSKIMNAKGYISFGYPERWFVLVILPKHRIVS